ncbi:MAG: TetR/AcrR family transcriptional regulator [Bacteroidota bacterium]
MKKGKIKKRLIIREGYKLMRVNGYLNTSVDEIVGSLKIPKGSFYYYFKTKEDFAAEVLMYYIANVSRMLENVLNDESISPKQRIIKLYSDYIDNFANKGGTVYGNFATNILQEIGGYNQKIKDIALSFFELVRFQHVECLQQARRSGEIDRNQDVEKLVMLIIYSWEGALLRVKSSGNIRSLFAFRELIRDFILK